MILAPCVLPACVPFRIRNETNGLAARYLLDFGVLFLYVNVMNIFDICNNIRTFFIFPGRGMYPYDTTWSHTRYVSYMSSSSTCNDTTECCCFLRLLAAVVHLHRTGTRACSRCVVVPDMVTAYFVPVFFSFCWGIFFPKISLNQRRNFMKQALKHQQRDSVETVSEGGCIIAVV